MAKRFLLTMAIAALGSAGCAQADNAKTLTLWHAWGGAELAALKALIATYKQSHPDLEVMALQVPYDKLKDKYLRSAAANGGPDLLIGDADWSGKFSASDLLLRTDALFTAEELARFNKGALASLTLGGKLYAVPESRETVVLYYNKDLMPTPPKTVSAWLAEAKAIDARTHGEAKGLVYKADFYTTMGYFFAHGGTLFGPTGQPTLDSPAGLAALTMVEGLSRAPGVMAHPEYAKADSFYKEGKAASIVNGPWALVDYQKALGDKLGLATLPTLDDGTPAKSWVGVKCLMFNNNGDDRHHRMAKDFALFMTTPESQRVLATQAGHVPAVEGVELPADSPLATFQAQADVGTPVMIAPEVSLVWDPMDKALRRVIQHDSTPSVALEDAQDDVAAKAEAMRGQKK